MNSKKIFRDLLYRVRTVVLYFSGQDSEVVKRVYRVCVKMRLQWFDDFKICVCKKRNGQTNMDNERERPLENQRRHDRVRIGSCESS